MSMSTTNTDMTTITYIVHLRPTPDATDPAGTRRLRSGLKTLLRKYGLRCTSVVPKLEDER